MYNFLGSYSGTWSFYKQLQLLKVGGPKWSKIKQLLSTARAQIVPRLKKLRMKLRSQHSTS